ncbi:hypothetical protein ACJ41O_012041 [Fusarium nematophilum]
MSKSAHSLGGLAEGGQGAHSPPKFIAIGVDFGTTYSGVSWTFSEQPDQIHEISEWPTAYHKNKNEIQVPTLYDIDSGKWGYEVTPDMTPMKWFKLLLLNSKDIAREEIRNSEQMKQARQQLSRNSKGLTAVQVVGYFLRELWNHTYAMLKTMLDVDNLPLRVAITVPAIWPPYAQAAMREAAAIAGIDKKRPIGITTLDLVQEPEAAGLSIMFERSGLPEIQKGETFVVCDAGGGTVDVISYSVVSDHPLVLKECVKGDGKLAGAVRIDEAFEAHLQDKTKLKLRSLSESEYNTFVTEEWEQGAKRSFSSSEDPAYFNLRPPIKAYKTMDREEMKSFFSNSLSGIQTLVGEQYEQVRQETGKRPKKILLVGGLGTSRYIYDVLDKQFKDIVLRPLNGWSAVARGAVLRLLRDKLSLLRVRTPSQEKVLKSFPEVTSRKSRYHYGIVVKPVTSIITDLDDEDEVERDPEGDLVTQRMDWFLKKGDDVDKRDPVLFSYLQFHQRPPRGKCKFHIKYSSADLPPKREDSTVSHLCDIECDWDKPFSQWKRVGDPAEGWRKHDDMALAMRFEGEPKWKVRVGSNQEEYDVRVQYMAKQ